jgi:competence protein ComEC
LADGILDDLVPNDDGPATGEFAPTLLRRLAALIGRYLADERERCVLWLPVALGGGIVFYFGLAAEPAFPVGWIARAGACVLAFVLRRQAAGIPVCSIIIAISLGFTASQVRTLTVMAPILGREIGPVPVTGRVLEIDHLEKGARIVLGDLAIPRLASAAVPARVRVTLRTNDNLPPPGAMIRLSAVLHPPPDPAVAGAFDFGRIAFFRRIGAVGFAISRPEIIGGPEPGFAQSIATTTERVRLHLAERVNRAICEW